MKQHHMSEQPVKSSRKTLLREPFSFFTLQLGIYAVTITISIGCLSIYFLMPFLYCRSDGLRAIFLKSLTRDKATNAFHLDVT